MKVQSPNLKNKNTNYKVLIVKLDKSILKKERIEIKYKIKRLIIKLYKYKK